MSQMQAEVDERKQLGQHGTGVHQVPHQRVPTQAGKENFMLWKTREPRTLIQAHLFSVFSRRDVLEIKPNEGVSFQIQELQMKSPVNVRTRARTCTRKTIRS